LVHGAAIVEALQKGAEYGIEVSLKGINGATLFAKKNAVVEQLRAGTEALIKKAPYDFIRGKAEFISASRMAVEGKTFDFKNAIIATGSRSRDLPGMVCDGRHVLNSEQLLALKALPRSMVIVGGGYIGCEWASILSTLGCEIIIVEMTDSLLPFVSSGITKRLEAHFKKKGITVKKSAKVTGVKITEGRVAVSLDNGETLQTEKVLVSVGRTANIDTCALDKAGVSLRDGFITTDKHLATNTCNIYAVGDVVNAPQLAHTAFHEAEVAVKNILHPGSAEVCYQDIPACIFTEPEIAFVGELKQKDNAKETRVVYGSNGKAHCESAIDGVLVMMTDNNKLIMGAEIIGKHASELISYVALAMKLKIPANVLAEVTFPHPTLSEIMAEAFRSAAS
jgi:dihydrolipoamide dehydrogenase